MYCVNNKRGDILLRQHASDACHVMMTAEEVSADGQSNSKVTNDEVFRGNITVHLRWRNSQYVNVWAFPDVIRAFETILNILRQR